MRHRSFSSAMRSVVQGCCSGRACPATRPKPGGSCRQARTPGWGTRQARTDEREAARDDVAAQVEEAETLSREVREQEQAAETLLARALTANPAIDLQARMETFLPATFDERDWPFKPPHKILPRTPGIFARMVPGASARHRRRVLGSGASAPEGTGRARGGSASARGGIRRVSEIRAEAEDTLEQENDALRKLRLGLGVGEHAAVLSYFQAVIDGSLKGEPDAVSAELGYSPDSKHLVVDLELSGLSTIPQEIGFKYVSRLTV